MTAHQHSLLNLEERISAFEKQWFELGACAISDYLPPVEDRHYIETLAELIRCDIELRWRSGQQKSVNDYLVEFPHLTENSKFLNSVLFEEYRLRSASAANESTGLVVEPWEYQQQYGVDVSDWPIWSSGCKDSKGNFKSEYLQLPMVGQSFCGFRLIGVLGKGASGQVYLARQNDLASRLVSLKVTRQSTRESVMLAQLQHTNIVPVFSTHQEGEFNSICMPFLGLSTLKDLLAVAFSDSRKNVGRDRSTQIMIATLARSRAETILETIPSKNEKLGFEKLVHDFESQNFNSNAAPQKNWSDLCLEMGVRIAEGLTHAHSHRVIHGDLKPANILISDEGQPVLLDFHLAQSSETQSRVEVVGGTIPYMAPEHLKSFKSGNSIEMRSDIYSFGVILFEMLTGLHLWNAPLGNTLDETINLAIAERVDPANLEQQLSTAKLDPDLKAIIRKCVKPGLADRYSQISHVVEDLRLHQRNYPLKFAKSLSIFERIKKWGKRHPKLSSVSTALTGAALVIAILTVVLITRNNRLAKATSLAESKDFLERIDDAKLGLSVISDDQAMLASSDEAALKLLEEFNAVTIEQLVNSPRFKRLPANMQQLEKSSLAKVFFWRAELLKKKTRRETNQPVIVADANKALEFNEIARQLLGEGAFWKGLELQRAYLLKSLGQTKEAQDTLKFVESLPDSPEDNSLLSAYLQHENFQTTKTEFSESTLNKLIERDPIDYTTWILVGNIYGSLQKPENAQASYSVAISLVPDELTGHYSLGRSFLETGKEHLASRCFEQAIKIAPEHANSHLNLGLSQQAQGKLKLAESSFSKAIELGTEHSRAWYLRSAVRNQLGKSESADEDLKNFLESEPYDSLDFLTRGAMLVSQDPDQSISDFENALAIDPGSKAAYQNIAHVYSEVKNDLPAAIDAMNRLVELDKSDPTTVATRGVVLAREGKRDLAIQDAEKALSLSNTADTKYRVAGIYSQLSKINADDAKMAVQLLVEAMFFDAKLVADYVPVDPDLDPIKNSEEFKEILQVLHFMDGNK